MSEREHGERERDQPEPGVEGGTGPGVAAGDVETPGAATTPNLPDEGDDGDASDGEPASEAPADR
jgi:hypothetical protein